MTQTTTPERSDTSTNKIDVALLPAFLTAVVAARLGVPSPGSVTEGRQFPAHGSDCRSEGFRGTCTHDGHSPDYSDGYGGTYAVGE